MIPSPGSGNILAMFSRRTFLRGSALALGASLPLQALFRRRARAEDFGPLIPDPDGILDLPDGFSYTIVEEAFDPMDDGYRVPGRADGMAAFAGPGGTVILLRNHEVSAGDFGNGPYGAGQSAPPEAYDAIGMGGVTRVVLDGSTFERISSNLVLVGTVRNCAGGPSPWGWLSCEENVTGDHGYVFLCPAEAEGVQMPQRIDGYGRYNHEAVAVDPSTNIAYLTEDRGDSALYRFVPDDVSAPFTGTLQAMRLVAGDNFDTSTGVTVGDRFDVAWVDIDDPTPSADTVRDEAASKGAAVISRGEGIWFWDGDVYICSTDGGDGGIGQIFKLTPAGDGGVLELVAQSESSSVLENPDNITVAAWGDVFMCEDGGGDQYVRILEPDGTIRDFARNAISGSEFAGACFSPDYRALFVNIQGDGLTLAITGPFPEVNLPEDPDAGPSAPDAGTDIGTDGGGNGGDGDGGGGGGCSAGGWSTDGLVVGTLAALGLGAIVGSGGERSPSNIDDSGGNGQDG